MSSEELKNIRTELGLTQGEFGKKYGYSAMAVSYWESGLREIPKHLIYKMTGSTPKNIWLICPHCKGSGKLKIKQ